MFPQLNSPALSAPFELLLTLYTDIGARTLDSLHSLTRLNLQLGRDLLTELGDGTQLPCASAALSHYQQQLVTMLSSTHSSLTQTAVSHLPAVRQASSTAVQQLLHSAAEQAARAAEHMSSYQMGSQLHH